LADDTLNNVSISHATYTRLNPYSAKKLTLQGTVSWTTTSDTAIFLRADELFFDSGAIVHANGESIFLGQDGGKGGSGGVLSIKKL